MATIFPRAFCNAAKSYGKHKHPNDQKMKSFHSNSNQLKVTRKQTFKEPY